MSLVNTGPEEEIVIHVFDENRKVNKDFKCEKNLLLSQMKYFEQYLQDAQSLDDIDISVHCDIKIFEWLMRYLKDNGEPKLDLKNVISILISSDFLGMKTLVSECVQFIKLNLSDVVRLPIDMNCLNSNLVKKISSAVSLEELINLKDKKDKLTSKIYMKKLEELTSEDYTYDTKELKKPKQNALNSQPLYRCAYCS